MKSLDLAPHELKCWIRIRIEASADPQHCLVDISYGLGYIVCKVYLVPRYLKNTVHISVWWPHTVLLRNATLTKNLIPPRHELSVDSRGLWNCSENCSENLKKRYPLATHFWECKFSKNLIGKFYLYLSLWWMTVCEDPCCYPGSLRWGNLIHKL